MPIVIGDPTNRIVVAVTQGSDEEAVAHVYADVIQRIAATEPHRLGLGDPGWNRANLAIVERWGDAGRERIKDRAWAIVRGRDRLDEAHRACLDALDRDILVALGLGVRGSL